jgi:hypothetical protein
MPGCLRTALSFLLENVGVFGEATRLMLVCCELDANGPRQEFQGWSEATAEPIRRLPEDWQDILSMLFLRLILGGRHDVPVFIGIDGYFSASGDLCRVDGLEGWDWRNAAEG